MGSLIHAKSPASSAQSKTPTWAVTENLLSRDIRQGGGSNHHIGTRKGDLRRADHHVHDVRNPWLGQTLAELYGPDAGLAFPEIYAALRCGEAPWAEIPTTIKKQTCRTPM